jgi:hypothetical protein
VHNPDDVHVTQLLCEQQRFADPQLPLQQSEPLKHRLPAEKHKDGGLGASTGPLPPNEQEQRWKFSEQQQLLPEQMQLLPKLHELQEVHEPSWP